jgi:hypothetical protein
MSTDTTGRFPPHLTDWSLDGTRTHVDFLEAVRTEHILISTDEEDDDTSQTQPRIPQQRFAIKNAAHARETEMTLFEGGWLSVREHRRNTPGVAQLLNLRYLDHEPMISRYVAKRSLYATIAFAVLGLAAGALAYASVLPGVMAAASTLLLFGSAFAFAACAYRTQKRVVFYTKHGRAPVLNLLGTIGSFRALRKVVPEISRAIRESAKRSDKHEEDLRSEMREHYRLRESGIIDQDTCSASTQRILRHF